MFVVQPTISAPLVPKAPRFVKSLLLVRELITSPPPYLQQNLTMARGKLIVFEGLDRAGKSTQCQMLAEALQKDGVKVRHMRFPGT
jgi:hypothetical protein